MKAGQMIYRLHAIFLCAVVVQATVRLHPARLTRQFKEADRIKMVLHTYRAHQNMVNKIHLSACWTSLGHLAKRKPAERSWLRMNEEALKPLVQQTVRAARTGSIGPRQLANVAYGMACSGRGGALTTVFATFAKAAEPVAEEFNAQELANTAWAFATVGHPDMGTLKLFKALANTAVGHINDFNAQELANVAWAFAKLGFQNGPLFMALANAAQRRIGEFNTQNLANMAWAFAREGLHDLPLFAMLGRVVERRVEEFKDQELANVAWAFAKMHHHDDALFDALAQASAQHLSDPARSSHLNAQQVSNMAWAFASVGRSDGPLFDALAKFTENFVEDFNAQDLANTAWAFATVGRSDASLFTALAGAAERHIDEFKPQDLSNTAWAFAVTNLYSNRLFGTIFAHRCEAATWLEDKAELSQLHQWVLWHQELKLPLPLSPALRNQCLEAFRTQHLPSHMQHEVATTLTELGAHLQEEVVIKEGYSVDIIVLWKGKQVAIEVDGPSHFLGHSASGATILKRRQMRAFGWHLVTIPYWEWSQVKGSKNKRQEYLLRLLQAREPRHTRRKNILSPSALLLKRSNHTSSAST
eukprot:gnl/MRDRNA2_/MRDRNA2_46926_c0_seq1.p1 gnl/MRDRNA2_/MRDRNA2_46926_c0~~gnl/MRDRNA2_/MRDRNA2_46926_c0_seq1.p1  ORF type:complete len:587 (-),score=107.87 gnl/MRDRNA2_/MRDRNA2_46926_c0_seq1:178-1938(-)